MQNCDKIRIARTLAYPADIIGITVKQSQGAISSWVQELCALEQNIVLTPSFYEQA